MSGYHALADHYDRFMSTDYEARADYILYVYRKHDKAPASLLDLACGSGSMTAAFHRRGIDMIGVDSSEEMLALAAEKCPDSLLLCQDMRELDLYDVVDGAVCTLDSFNHLPDTKAIGDTLDRLRLFIAPNGLLVFDVNTPYKHQHILGDNTFVFEEDGVMCVWQNEFDKRGCTVRMMLDFFEETEDGLYERTSEYIKERAYELATWRRLLKEHGFCLLAAYDDMTETPATDTAERWLLVAQNDRPAEEYSA